MAKHFRTVAGYFTESRYRRLKARYEEAIKAEEEQFQFEGQTILTSFAKYLVQYLDGKFK